MIFQSVSFNSIMDLYLKNIHLLPGHDYELTMEIYGGCINVYVASYGILHGLGSNYIKQSETWQRHSFCFTAKPTATPQELSTFSDWGIAFVKKYGEVIPTASGNTYIRNVHLIDPTCPEHDLIAGGDFAAPLGDPAYFTNWKGTILGEKGRELGVAIIPDPLLSGGRCLLLPEMVNMTLYPEQLPLSCPYCGVVKNNTTIVSPLLHDGNPILLVKKGRAEVSFGGRTLTATDNQAIFVPTVDSVASTLYPYKDSEYYWISISGEYAKPFLKKLGFSDFAIHPIRGINTLTPYINALMNTSLGNTSYLYEVSSHLQLFLAEWEKQQRITTSGVHRAAIEKIIESIQRSPEQPISNDDLAESLGITAKHFISIFKSHVGAPPQKYRQQQLIKKACVLLLDTSMTVQEISYALGVEDPLYFSRLFRSIQGISPRDYRKHRSIR